MSDHSSKAKAVISALKRLLLKRCIAEQDLELAEHGYSVCLNDRLLNHHPYLGCLLIRLFSSCGSLARSYQVFQEMPEQNVYAWTEIISAYVDHGEGDQALALYQQMLLSSVNPSSHTFVSALRACLNPQFSLLECGKLIHTDIVERGADGNRFIGSSLVGMYAGYGRMGDASSVFHGLGAPDEVSWSQLIGGYAKNGLLWEAFAMVEEEEAMHRREIQPNKATIITLLSSFSTASSCSSLISKAENLHSHAVERGLELDSRLSSSLVRMYGRCRRLGDARSVFEGSSGRDLVSWNAMLASLAEHGCAEEAFRLVARMKEEGMNPNDSTFVSLLRSSCCCCADEARIIHGDVVKLGLDPNAHLGCSLLGIYAKCGDLTDARHVFRKHPLDVGLASTMMKGYADHGLVEEAKALYVEMLSKDVSPDECMHVCILQACAESFGCGLLMHSDVIEQKLEKHRLVANGVVEMYIACGELESAQSIFDKLPAQDMATASSLISAHAEKTRPQHGCEEAFRLFSGLWREEHEPDKVAYLSVVKICSSMSALRQGTLVYEAIVQRGLDGDDRLGSASIRMFSSCGSLEDAGGIFDVMSRCSNDDEGNLTLGFSAMISGYLVNDDLEMALHLFRRMQEQALHPDAITCIGLLKACSGLGALEQGRQIHAYMEKRGLGLVDPWHHHHRIALANMYARCGSPVDADTALQNAHPSDSTTWSTILAPCIHGYVLCASDTTMEAAIERLQEEEAASTMDGIAYLCSLLKACSSSSDAHQGLLIHAQIQKLGLASDPDIQDALLDMHAKCGNVECACDTFDRAEHSRKDVRSWTMILACFAEHGLVDMVGRYLRAMHGMDILPDSPFVVCILCACNHSGLLEEALHCLASAVETSSDRIVAVEHYICIMDLFGRLGRSDASEMVAWNMPFQPNPAAWLVLLSSCAKHDHGSSIAIARRAYSCAMELR